MDAGANGEESVGCPDCGSIWISIAWKGDECVVGMGVLGALSSVESDLCHSHG